MPTIPRRRLTTLRSGTEGAGRAANPGSWPAWRGVKRPPDQRVGDPGPRRVCPVWALRRCRRARVRHGVAGPPACGSLHAAGRWCRTAARVGRTDATRSVTVVDGARRGGISETTMRRATRVLGPFRRLQHDAVDRRVDPGTVRRRPSPVPPSVHTSRGGRPRQGVAREGSSSPPSHRATEPFGPFPTPQRASSETRYEVERIWI